MPQRTPRCFYPKPQCRRLAAVKINGIPCCRKHIGDATFVASTLMSKFEKWLRRASDPL